MVGQKRNHSDLDRNNEDETPRNGDEKDNSTREGDLFPNQGDDRKTFMQWFQALDLQILGGCRVEERLKPLLKLNLPCGPAEDRLLSHLNQNFEVSEVGMLARCLCLPLVSIRVGKVLKQGNLLIPTGIRGYLNVMLLPSSDLHLVFIGDDGNKERLFTLSSNAWNSRVVIEEISVDTSGRSFLMGFSEDRISYFWSAEKSNNLGQELLRKMKDILKSRPTLAQLTGISELRLDSFTEHLCSYLQESATVVSEMPVAFAYFDSSELGLDAASSSMGLAQSRSFPAQMAILGSLCQSSFSSALSISNVSGPCSPCATRGLHSQVDPIKYNLPAEQSASFGVRVSAIHPSFQDKIADAGEASFAQAAAGVPFVGPLSVDVLHAPDPNPLLFSPYYCWCPPCSATPQVAMGGPHFPARFLEPLTLSPVSSTISSRSISIQPSKPSDDLVDNSLLDMPDIFLHPFTRFPVSVASIVKASDMQQIPTFTPLISDPIVHIPVIDVCSSGKGYLVSAGPTTLSSTLSPLMPSVINHPLIPETESLLESSARDTLRLLVGSQSSPLLEVFAEMKENLQRDCVDTCRTLVNAGSRGLYCGTRDVSSRSTSLSLGPFSAPNGSKGADDLKGLSNLEDSGDRPGKQT